MQPKEYFSWIHGCCFLSSVEGYKCLIIQIFSQNVGISVHIDWFGVKVNFFTNSGTCHPKFATSITNARMIKIFGIYRNISIINCKVASLYFSINFIFWFASNFRFLGITPFNFKQKFFVYWRFISPSKFNIYVLFFFKAKKFINFQALKLFYINPKVFLCACFKRKMLIIEFKIHIFTLFCPFW